MCQNENAGFPAKKAVFCTYFDLGVQAFAQVAQRRLCKFFGSLFILCFTQCGGTYETKVRINPESSPGADAVLVNGKHLFIFDFSHSRFQKWSLPEVNGKESCALTDTLMGDWAQSSNWLTLASPVQPFQPSQAIWGPNGNFFILDRIHKRLALYDTNAQFLSGFSLPFEFKERNLNKMDVYWTRDGLFSFLDRGEGRVWKFSELRSTGSSGEWQLRYSVNLPLGLKSCIWEPFSKHPACLKHDTASPIVFDEYFNRTQDSLQLLKVGGVQATLDSGKKAWNLLIPGSPSCGLGVYYLFSSESDRFTRINPPPQIKPDSVPKQP